MCNVGTTVQEPRGGVQICAFGVVFGGVGVRERGGGDGKVDIDEGKERDNGRNRGKRQERGGEGKGVEGGLNVHLARSHRVRQVALLLSQLSKGFTRHKVGVSQSSLFIFLLSKSEVYIPKNRKPLVDIMNKHLPIPTP